MTTLTQCNQQWSSRPADERFLSLTALNEFTHSVRASSKARQISSRGLQAVPVEGDHKALQVEGPTGARVDVTNWSFGQLAARAGAPAGYLRSLPAPMACDCINFGLQHEREIEDVGVLLTAAPDGGVARLAAVTGPAYGRIWNSQITGALVERFGDGRTGTFRVPGEFGKQVAISKDNTTLYASDRDMFVFLADEEHRIELPNRRDGKTGSMARGFFVWNSEVGSSTLGISTFLFDYVCSNRLVWGASNISEIKIRHTGGAADRWLQEVVPAIQTYANGSTAGIVASIEDARSRRIDDVAGFLAKRFSRAQSSAIMAAHMTDEARPIETLWDAATGITAYARNIQHQDARVQIEREAGKLLEAA